MAAARLAPIWHKTKPKVFNIFDMNAFLMKFLKIDLKIGFIFAGIPAFSSRETGILESAFSRDFLGREFPGIPGFLTDFSRDGNFSRDFPGNSREFMEFCISRFPGNRNPGKLQTLPADHPSWKSQKITQH